MQFYRFEIFPFCIQKRSGPDYSGVMVHILKKRGDTCEEKDKMDVCSRIHNCDFGGG